MKKKKQYQSLQKAIDACVWMNFESRLIGTSLKVLEESVDSFWVVPNLKMTKLEKRKTLKDYSKMSFQDIKDLKTDPYILDHWEKITGMFSVENGEILRFLLAYKVPLDKFIKVELANRGYDKDHQWCGFDKAEEIWLN